MSPPLGKIPIHHGGMDLDDAIHDTGAEHDVEEISTPQEQANDDIDEDERRSANLIITLASSSSTPPPPLSLLCPSPPLPRGQRRRTLHDELLAIDDHLELDDESTLLNDEDDEGDERIPFDRDEQRSSTRAHVDLNTCPRVSRDVRFTKTEGGGGGEEEDESEDEDEIQRGPEMEGGFATETDAKSDSQETGTGTETEDDNSSGPEPEPFETFLSHNAADLSSWHSAHRRLSSLPPDADTHMALSRHAETLYTWLNVSALPYIDALERYAHEKAALVNGDALLDHDDDADGEGIEEQKSVVDVLCRVMEALVTESRHG
ncbi:hypothetical protein PV08_01770 [Exophiala spinifera]|uniref:Uncharacterized protein n=1 Tax=Exophiala spinifera TaxID=91928 RepID=A0A0D2BRZ1_9EURO|nr:uncharacterized protein PV08_01770 [Exophiala spinifera]KIW21190.1 hypothetical protein PV08_01770 [Exophiala spinifera]